VAVFVCAILAERDGGGCTSIRSWVGLKCLVVPLEIITCKYLSFA
jgi:hypothetical protein